MFLDDKYFLQKTREQILSEAVALQQRRQSIPIPKNNYSDMPYGESRIVCRDEEIQMLKSFIYGKPEDLRKQHAAQLGSGNAYLLRKFLLCDMVSVA